MFHRDPLHYVGDRTPYVKHNLQPLLFTTFVGHVLLEAGLLLSISSSTSSTGTLLHLFCAPENRTGFIPLKQRVHASMQADLPHSSHPRRSYAQSRSLLFTMLERNMSYMKHLEHGYLPRELNLYRSKLNRGSLSLPLRCGRSNITHIHD